MTARTPSTSEVNREIAREEMRGMFTAVPGIVRGYVAGLHEVEMDFAVYAADEPAPPLPVTGPVRLPGGSMFGVQWAPAPGDHCTIIFHGLDPSAFFSAPMGGQRQAELVKQAGVYPECWPSMYGPTAGVIDATALWVGRTDHTVGIRVSDILQLGNATALEPLIKGTSFLVYFNLFLTNYNAHLHVPGLPPTVPMTPPPPTVLSTQVLTA